MEASQVIRQAGMRGSDKSKFILINMIPSNLWSCILPKLRALTPYDCEPWSLAWANDAGVDSLDEKGAGEFTQEQLIRMHRLVLEKGVGSKLYALNLENEQIGCAGASAVEWRPL